MSDYISSDSDDDDFDSYSSCEPTFDSYAQKTLIDYLDRVAKLADGCWYAINPPTCPNKKTDQDSIAVQWSLAEAMGLSQEDFNKLLEVAGLIQFSSNNSTSIKRHVLEDFCKAFYVMANWSETPVPSVSKDNILWVKLGCVSLSDNVKHQFERIKKGEIGKPTICFYRRLALNSIQRESKTLFECVERSKRHREEVEKKKEEYKKKEEERRQTLALRRVLAIEFHRELSQSDMTESRRDSIVCETPRKRCREGW